MRISDWSSDVCSSDLCRNQVLRSTEISRVQLQIHDAVPGVNSRHSAIDNGAVGNDAAVQLIDLHTGSARFRTRAAHQQIALSYGVDLAVGALERSDEHKSELQSLMRN